MSWLCWDYYFILEISYSLLHENEFLMKYLLDSPILSLIDKSNAYVVLLITCVICLIIEWPSLTIVPLSASYSFNQISLLICTKLKGEFMIHLYNWWSIWYMLTITWKRITSCTTLSCAKYFHILSLSIGLKQLRLRTSTMKRASLCEGTKG
jgi:hypothetical protein